MARDASETCLLWAKRVLTALANTMVISFLAYMIYSEDDNPMMMLLCLSSASYIGAQALARIISSVEPLDVAEGQTGVHQNKKGSKLIRRGVKKNKGGGVKTKKEGAQKKREGVEK